MSRLLRTAPRRPQPAAEALSVAESHEEDTKLAKAPQPTLAHFPQALQKMHSFFRLMITWFAAQCGALCLGKCSLKKLEGLAASLGKVRVQIPSMESGEAHQEAHPGCGQRPRPLECGDWFVVCSSLSAGATTKPQEEPKTSPADAPAAAPPATWPVRAWAMQPACILRLALLNPTVPAPRTPHCLRSQLKQRRRKRPPQLHVIKSRMI